MKRQEKDVLVGELQQKLSEATAFYLTDFTGLNVKQMTQLRRRFRQNGIEYVVVKNTLAQRALSGLDLPPVADSFAGPTGMAIGRDDAVAAAKVLTDFAKEFGDRPTVKAAVVERKEYSAEQVKALAGLPSKEVLLAQIAGGLQAPLARLAGGMNQILAGFARAMDALRQQREGTGT